MRVVDEEILKRKERKLKNYIKDSVPKRSNRLDRFPADLLSFLQKEVVPERAFAPYDVCRYVIQFHNIGFLFSVCSQTTTATAVAVSNNDAVLSRCPSALFPRVSTFRYLTSQAAYKNICRIIFCQSKLRKTLTINDTTAWVMLQQTCSSPKLTRAKCVLVYLHFNQVILFNKGKCISRSMLLCLLKIIMRE